MANKDLDEDKIIILEMNKRDYHILTGLMAEKNYKFKRKVLGERKI